MKKIILLVLMTTLSLHAVKISIGGSHLVGLHYEIDLSDTSLLDTSIGFFDFQEIILAASHQFLVTLSSSSDLYIGYGAFTAVVPAGGILLAAKIPFGWRKSFKSGSQLSLGIDINYLMGFTDQKTGQWSTVFKNDMSRFLPFPFIAYSF